MKSLLVFEPKEVGGSFYYRVSSPLTTLQTFKTNFQQTVSGLEECDAAFFWTPRTDVEFKAIAGFVKRKVPVVLDFDDNVFDLPKHLKASAYYTPERLNKIKQAMSVASAIFVSSEQLAKEMEWLSSKIHVTQNAHDFDLFQYAPIPRQQKLLLWRGAQGHDDDFATVLPELTVLLNQFPDWRLIIAGEAPAGAKYIEEKSKVTIPFGHIVEYMRGCQKLSPPIMIVPLAESNHNRNKSNCSWLEGTYFGSAVLAPKFPQFQIDGITNYDDPQDFRMKLEWLMKRKGAEKFVKRSREQILHGYSIMFQAARREEILNALM